MPASGLLIMEGRRRGEYAEQAAGLQTLVELLGRRGGLDVLAVLQGPAMTERALTRRLNQLSPSLVAQRVSELRDLGVVEVVPETDELRLSPRGRRLQGLLDGLAAWSEQG